LYDLWGGDCGTGDEGKGVINRGKKRGEVDGRRR